MSAFYKIGGLSFVWLIILMDKASHSNTHKYIVKDSK